MTFDLPLSLEIFVEVKFCGFHGLLKKLYTIIKKFIWLTPLFLSIHKILN